MGSEFAFATVAQLDAFDAMIARAFKEGIEPPALALMLARRIEGVPLEGTFGERVTPQHVTRRVEPDVLCSFRGRVITTVELHNKYPEAMRADATLLGSTLRIELSSVHWPKPLP